MIHCSTVDCIVQSGEGTGELDSDSPGRADPSDSWAVSRAWREFRPQFRERMQWTLHDDFVAGLQARLRRWKQTGFIVLPRVFDNSQSQLSHHLPDGLLAQPLAGLAR